MRAPCILLITAIACAGAGETQSTLLASLPDWPSLHQRLRASWQPIRAALDQAGVGKDLDPLLDQVWARFQAKTMVDARLLRDAAGSLRLVVRLDPEDHYPPSRVELTMARDSQTLWGQLGKMPGAVAAADGKRLDFDNTYAFTLEGQRILYEHRTDGLPALPAPVRDGSDLSGELRVAVPTAGKDATDPALAWWRYEKLSEFVISFTMRFGTDGWSSRMVCPHRFKTMSLRAMDPTVLRALPETTAFVLAAGFDGPAVATMRKQMSQELGEASREVPALDSVQGTCFLAAMPGTLTPVVVAGIPASPALDALLTAEAGSRGIDLGPSRERCVAVPLPNGVPLLLFVRRSAGYWLAGNDTQVLETLAAGTGDTFTRSRLWQELSSASGPVTFATAMDLAAVARVAAAYLPFLAMRAPKEDQGMLQRLTVAVHPIAAHLPMSCFRVIVPEGRQETIIEERNGLPVIGMLAGLLVPAVNIARDAANRARVSSDMHQIVACSIVHADAHAQYPATLEALAKTYPEEVPLILRRLQAGPAPALRYVQPGTTLSPAQPVLMDNPARWQGRGHMVAFGDAHTEWRTGDAYWRAAEKLSTLGRPATTKDWDKALGTGPSAPVAP